MLSTSNNPLLSNKPTAGKVELERESSEVIRKGSLTVGEGTAAKAGNPVANDFKRILIFTGGALGEWALDEIRSCDILIGADRGALFLVKHGFTPDLALGDFDSVTLEELELIRRASRSFEDCDPVMKDWTDTEMAFTRAMEWYSPQRPPHEIVLLGALGSRFDHSIANIHLLRKGLECGIDCRIVDANNDVRIIGGGSSSIVRGDFTHISLLPLTLEVLGITLVGFQYPLVKATLTIGQSLGISNILHEPVGQIEVGEGLLLVIQCRD